MVDIVVDTTGLNCPLPILRARKGLKNVAPGGTMLVLATDPAAVTDFEVYCRETGHELLETGEENGTYSFLIRRVG
jgi:tRNA 2-thiouridine synthesizing protein A